MVVDSGRYWVGYFMGHGKWVGESDNLAVDLGSLGEVIERHLVELGSFGLVGGEKGNFMSFREFDIHYDYDRLQETDRGN